MFKLVKNEKKYIEHLLKLVPLNISNQEYQPQYYSILLCSTQFLIKSLNQILMMPNIQKFVIPLKEAFQKDLNSTNQISSKRS